MATIVDKTACELAGAGAESGRGALGKEEVMKKTSITAQLYYQPSE